MKFFNDTNLDPNLSIGITSLLSNITTRPGSHKGGWARLLRCQLNHIGYKNVKILDNKDSLSNFDVIIFDLGAEYSGALNLFGGLDEKVYKRLNEIKSFTGSFFSWKNELPDLSVLESRRNNSSTCDPFKQEPPEFLSDVQQKLSACKVFDHAYGTDAVLIGDSHTPSVWTPDLMIERRDGRTLRGMVENKTVEKIIGKFTSIGININHVHVHCSSIDIRHHICRTDEPMVEILNLAAELVSNLETLKIPKVTLNHTMGIEDESRELPKTGYFKGTPFFGEWAQRNKARSVFNCFVDSVGPAYEWTVIKFPDYFFDESDKLKFEVMEVPGSVHLSPEHYRWNLDTNEKRW